MTDKSPQPATAAETDGMSLAHTLCKLTGLENGSNKICSNGQYVFVDRLVKKGAAAGRYKVRVVGSHKACAIKVENLEPQSIPGFLFQTPLGLRLDTNSDAPDLTVFDVDAVGRSCHEFLSSVGQEHITVCAESVHTYVVKLRAELADSTSNIFKEVQDGRTGACRRLPLQFPSVDHEINFWVIQRLLCFGSGYVGGSERLRDIVERGMINIFIAKSQRFDAEFMSTFTLHDVQDQFGVKVEEDVNVIGSAVKRSQIGGALVPFARDIVQALNTCGQKLRRLGCNDFAMLLLLPGSVNEERCQQRPVFVGPGISTVAHQKE